MLNTVRARRAVAAVAAAAATAGMIVGFGVSPASAERHATDASGSTTIQLTMQTFRALSSSECGALSAAALGDATVTSSRGGKLQVVFPVTGLLYTDTGHIQIQHGGSGVELHNGCYDVRLSGLHIQNFGEDSEGESLDVLAKRKTSDDSDEVPGRALEFTLDFGTARSTVKPKGSYASVKTRSINLLLARTGAEDFNKFVGDTDEEPATCDGPCDPTTTAAASESSDGPFSAGDQIGKARSVIRVRYEDAQPPSGDA